MTKTFGDAMDIRHDLAVFDYFFAIVFTHLAFTANSSQIPVEQI